MGDTTPTYRSFVLRLWQDTPQALWRSTVQSIQTNQIDSFADLDALFAFLAAQTAPADSGDHDQLQVESD